MSGKSMILKVSFNEIKLKFQIQDDSQNVKVLKNEISSRLAEQGIVLEEQQFDCLDSDDFKLSNMDKISSVLQENDLIKIVLKPTDQLIQQQQLQLQQGKLIQENEQKNPLIDDPNEAIVVLYDTSGSMSQSFFNDKDLSRMGAVNAFFSAFADRTLAFEFNHIVKLVCFNNVVEDKSDFLADFNKFIALVDSCNPLGSTKCYDAIDYAINCLIQQKSKYPNVTLRIIALTDGEDNKSQCKPQDLVHKIIKYHIIIDSFVVGTQCTGLKTLTHASGGRCYCPTEINQGLELFEVDTILSVSQREKVTLIPEECLDLEQFKERPFDTEGLKPAKPKAATFAALKKEDIIKEYQKVIEQQEVQQKQQQVQPDLKKAPQSVGSNTTKRIYKELNEIQMQQTQEFKVFPTSSIHDWRILLLAPQDSVYANGIYILSCHFPQDYPFKPPQLLFLNKIYHCNINGAGKICLDVLKDQWSPALTVSKVLLSILSLLQNPNSLDAIESTVASVYNHNKPLFEENAKNNVIMYAIFNTEELVKEALGEGIDKNSQQFKDTQLEIEAWLILSNQQDKGFGKKKS